MAEERHFNRRAPSSGCAGVFHHHTGCVTSRGGDGGPRSVERLIDGPIVVRPGARNNTSSWDVIPTGGAAKGPGTVANTLKSI
jgi:hypothetical protein